MRPPRADCQECEHLYDPSNRREEADIEAAGQWLTAIEDKLPNSTFKALASFLKCYFRVTLIGQKIARRVTHPSHGTIDVSRFCQDVRAIWSDLKQLARRVNQVAKATLDYSDHYLIGFSPLNYLSNIRLACPLFMLILHQAIRDRLDSESRSAHIEESGALDALHLESVDILLDNCRSQTAMFQVCMDLGTS